MNARRLTVRSLAVAGAIAVAVTLAAVFAEPLALLFDRNLPLSEKADAVKTWLGGWGPAAPFIYVAFVTMEVVVAPLPGLFLYAPGGVLFGGFAGGGLALAGNTLGAGLACLLMRRFGYDRLQRLLTENGQALQQRLARHGFWVVLLLRLNPLTSSDMVSYAAGLTAMPVWQVMLATCLGMAPLCFAQSILAAELFTAFPALLLPMVAACVVYLVVVAIVFTRLSTSPSE